VADLPTLKEALGTTSRTTVFRALSEAGYYASYSHAGRFYTLEHIPDFDSHGIWEHADVLFSKLRTLRCTILHMVGSAPAGHTHAELQVRVHLRVHDTLHDLFTVGQIGRVDLEHERSHLYVSAASETAEAQVAERHRIGLEEASAVALPEATVIIEVLLAFIRHPDEDATAVASRLRHRGLSREHVDRVFAHYGLGKKNRVSRRLQR